METLQRQLTRSLMFVTALVFCAMPMACDGGAEEVGEDVDEVVDDAADAVDDAIDG